MRYFYAFIFVISSLALSSFSYSESNETQAGLPEMTFDTILLHSERCGDIVLEGWSLWEGGVCLGFSYTYTSERCNTITVEGISPPNGLFDGTNVNPNYFLQVSSDPGPGYNPPPRFN